MKEKILEYIIEEFSQNATDIISYDTELITNGYIDSFSTVSVCHYLEKTFNIKIPDRQITPENFNTVEKMTDLVIHNLK